MKKISRADQKYKDVEKFKDYELTQCITYEMAIRNQEVVDLVEQRESIGMLDDLNDMQVEELKKMDSDEKVKAFADSYLKGNPERVEKLYSVIELDERIKELSFYAIPSPDNTNTKLLEENIHFRRYLTNSSQRAQAKKSNIMDSATLGYMFNDDGTVKTTAGGIIKYTDLFPKFSRPLPIIPTRKSKEIDLLLNLALPLNDLNTYISTIKEAYERNEGEAFQVSDPLSLATEIDDEIFRIRSKIKQNGSDTNLKIPTKTKQDVYADLLFFYDVFTSGMDKSERIQYCRYKMIDHYAEKVAHYNNYIKDKEEVAIHISTPRDDTINKCVTMMQEYIDNFGYKKLLA